MHTEGSWYYSNGYVRVHSKDQRKDGMILAATMSVETYEGRQANGRLMAAAPKMYEVIKKFIAEARVLINIVEVDSSGKVICGDYQQWVSNDLFNEAESLLAGIDGEAGNE